MPSRYANSFEKAIALPPLVEVSSWLLVAWPFTRYLRCVPRALVLVKETPLSCRPLGGRRSDTMGSTTLCSFVWFLCALRATQRMLSCMAYMASMCLCWQSNDWVNDGDFKDCHRHDQMGTGMPIPNHQGSYRRCKKHTNDCWQWKY